MYLGYYTNFRLELDFYAISVRCEEMCISIGMGRETEKVESFYLLEPFLLLLFNQTLSSLMIGSGYISAMLYLIETRT